MSIFSPKVSYNPLIENGDSSPFFGAFEQQHYGQYDTQCCWDFSACEVMETRLELLRSQNLIPQDTLNWLQDNGYIDSSGDFYLSRRWGAILSGVRDAGNSPMNFWNIVGGKRGAGFIPNSMLPYNPQDAQKWITKDQFNNDYFNPQVITKEMELLGQEFACRFTVLAETLRGGYLKDISTSLQTYLKEGSMQIGIPIENSSIWNTGQVTFNGTILDAMHEVELYKLDLASNFPFKIFDSYQPKLKQLAQNYYIPNITRVSVTANTFKQITPVAPSAWQMFWDNVFAWLQGKVSPYPAIPVG